MKWGTFVVVAGVILSPFSSQGVEFPEIHGKLEHQKLISLDGAWIELTVTASRNPIEKIPEVVKKKSATVQSETGSFVLPGIDIDIENPAKNPPRDAWGTRFDYEIVFHFPKANTVDSAFLESQQHFHFWGWERGSDKNREIKRKIEEMFPLFESLTMERAEGAQIEIPISIQDSFVKQEKGVERDIRMIPGEEVTVQLQQAFMAKDTRQFVTIQTIVTKTSAIPSTTGKLAVVIPPHLLIRPSAFDQRARKLTSIFKLVPGNGFFPKDHLVLIGDF